MTGAGDEPTDAPGSAFELRIVDSHMHQWDPVNTPRSPILRIGSVVDVPAVADFAFKFFPRSHRESIADPAYLSHPYLVADYRRDIGSFHVDAAVHVDSGWRGRGEFAPVDETRWVASLPFENYGPRLGAIVAAADPRSPRFADVLEAHRDAAAQFRGIRCIATHHQDKGVRSWTNDPRLLVQPRFLDGFAKLAARDLTFDAWVYSHDLPDVAELARRYPEVTIVLNHIGTPAGIFGPIGHSTGRSEAERRGLLDAWRDDIAAVAERPNVVVKLSGLMLPVLGHELPLRGRSVPVPELVRRIRPLVEHTVAVFGTDRTMWGSNSPLEKPVSGFAGIVDTIVDVMKPLGNTALDDVFRATAMRVYSIADAPARRA